MAKKKVASRAAAQARREEEMVGAQDRSQILSPQDHQVQGGVIRQQSPRR